MENKETLHCWKCGKIIDEDEYCICWGYCHDCLNADYSEYLRQHPETLSADNATAVPS